MSCFFCSKGECVTGEAGPDVIAVCGDHARRISVWLLSDDAAMKMTGVRKELRESIAGLLIEESDKC